MKIGMRECRFNTREIIEERLRTGEQFFGIVDVNKGADFIPVHLFVDMDEITPFKVDRYGTGLLMYLRALGFDVMGYGSWHGYFGRVEICWYGEHWFVSESGSFEPVGDWNYVNWPEEWMRL